MINLLSYSEHDGSGMESICLDFDGLDYLLTMEYQSEFISLKKNMYIDKVFLQEAVRQIEKLDKSFREVE